VTLADRRLHLLGIGGAGMSALAVVAYAWGADVSGCDRAESEYSQRLRRFGIEVAEGHDRAHLEPGMEVVVSSAVPDELDELAAASELGLRVTGRGELLAELVALRRSICVAGAHGKTTTTAMIAYAAHRIGLEPTWLVGGEVPQLGGNAGPGSGDMLVAEADESDGSCALLRPRVAVVTNVDLDHHTRFGSLAEVEQLFAEWVAHVPGDGAVVLGDGVSLPAGAAPVVRFGFDAGADWHVTGFRARREGSRFWLSVPGEAPLDVGLKVPGAHNARNAAGALAALAAAGASPADAADALADFTGVGRRFELRGTVAGATIVDDYAHNPAKVAAVIDAARTYAPARVVVCFQPHLYSRTAASAHAFGAALVEADEVVVTEIYAARERPVAGVTAKLVVDAVSERRPGMPLAYMPSLDDAAGYLRGRLREGDLVLTVGAGDVRRVGDTLLR
jgi:UDP-N-acetylmuramate--alanine ligase